MVVEAFATEVGSGGVNDQRAVEAGAGRAVHVVDEALAGLDGQRNLEKTFPGSDTTLKITIL